MSFHHFTADDGSPLGSFEVFHNDTTSGDPLMIDGYLAEGGWYWWACFPGCLPDSDPSGPYATEAEAIAAAREDE